MVVIVRFAITRKVTNEKKPREIEGRGKQLEASHIRTVGVLSPTHSSSRDRHLSWASLRRSDITEIRQSSLFMISLRFHSREKTPLNTLKRKERLDRRERISAV